jgi:hypothetical protein
MVCRNYSGSILPFFRWGEDMLKTVFDFAKILLWVPLVGTCAFLVSFFPERRRSAIETMMKENAWLGFSFLSRKKVSSQNIGSEKGQESMP